LLEKKHRANNVAVPMRFRSLAIVHDDELIHGPILKAPVREIPSDREGNLLLPELLHRNLKGRVRKSERESEKKRHKGRERERYRES